MRADALGSQLARGEPVGLLDVRADDAAARPLLGEEQREVLRAEHPPDRVESSRRAGGVDAQRQRCRRGPRPGVASTGSDRSPGSDSTAASDDTAYQAGRPRAPVVSQYHGPGTASTSRPPWSIGSHGPSGESARWTR